MSITLLLLLLSLETVQDPPGAETASSVEVAQPGPLLDEALRRRAATLRRPDELPEDATNRFSDDVAAARLGEKLFFDPGLSGDGNSSCATCHDPEKHFTDGKTHPRGFNRIPRDTPTLLDVSRHRWWGWDGRWDSLWMQALAPIEAEEEMKGDRLLVLRHIAATEPLRAQYQQLFGSLPDLAGLPERAYRGGFSTESWQAISSSRRLEVDRAFANVGKAIASFERSLPAPSTPFDRYLDALAREDLEDAKKYPISARRGFHWFLSEGNCISCHGGPLLSDGEFHDTGILSSGSTARDAGRYGGVQELRAGPFRSSGHFSDAPKGATARRTDSLRRDASLWGAFRTPSLRYLVGTEPYFHDGGMKDLRAVIRFYSWREGARPVGAGHSHQGETLLKAFTLTRQEEDDLIHFLESLSPTPLSGTESEGVTDGVKGL